MTQTVGIIDYPSIPFTFGGGNSLCKIFSFSCWKDSAKKGGCPVEFIFEK